MAENKPLFEKKVLIFVIVLFALVASLIAASYLSSVKNTPPIAVQPMEEPTVTPIITAVPIPESSATSIPVTNIDISDWRTYVNEEIGFSFQYPKNWDLFSGNKSNVSDKSVNLVSPETLKNISIDRPESPTSDMVINYYPSIKEYSSDVKTLDELIKNDGMIMIGEILIDKLKGVEVIERGLWDSYAIFIEKDNHLYEMSFISSTGRSNVTSIEWRILSSFKFIK